MVAEPSLQTQAGHGEPAAGPAAAGGARRREAGDWAVLGAGGPFLFCDYWASVFGLRNIVRSDLLARGLVSLEHFRKALDRPRTRLPKLRYYILAFVLAPALFPYKVVYDLMRLMRRRGERVEHPVDLLMGRYRLLLEPDGEAPDRVAATLGRRRLASGLIDPERVRVEVSLFYPTYKLLFAGLCSVILSLGVMPLLWRLDAAAPLRHEFTVTLVVLMVLTLLAIFRDLLTALLAPLPVVAVRYMMLAPQSRGGLLLAALGFIALYFVVEWFFLPRQLPPSLFLYDNDPAAEHFPYEPRHAPYWLDGRHYWVWRFMAFAPGELTKFWEKDWERVEVWVRADGEQAGMPEWVVYDCHYRELWFSYQRLTRRERGARLAAELRASLRRGRRPLWILETDMDLLFHAPFVRGLFLTDSEHTGRWSSLRRLLSALAIRPRKDRFERFEPRLADLEIDGTEFLADVPEHIRGPVLRGIIRMPWDYWRYPLGAAAARRPLVYEEAGTASATAPPASDRRYQVKQPESCPYTTTGRR